MTDATQRQLARYQSLLNVAGTLAGTSSMEQLLQAYHEQVRQLFEVSLTVLARLQPDGHWDCITLEENKVIRATFPVLTDGLLERVLSGELRLEADIHEYSARTGVTMRNLNQRPLWPPVRAWMGVPLQADARRRVLGVLSLQSYEHGIFNEEDLEFLTLLGRHLSIALENAELHDRLQREASTDPLTGLLNRRSFNQAVGELLSAKALAEHPVTLAILDVQDFKQINDKLGHHAGDQVLRTLGQLLSEQALWQNHCFRLGGDEFALILYLPEARARQAIADFISKLSNQPWPMPWPLQINVGLAQAAAGFTPDDWTRHADDQMYVAKKRHQTFVE